MRTTTIILIVFIIIMVYIVARDSILAREESFATVGDKARTLSLWMRKNGGASTYTGFIADNPDSNIVEYNKLRALYDSGRINSHSAVVESLKI